MTFDIRSPEVVAWLDQFQGEDQATARDLLDHIEYVEADVFRDAMTNLIVNRLNKGPTPIGLYAERKVGARKGIAHRLFKETKNAVKRAHGAGPPPVRSQHAGRHETGSEGIVANIITQIVRQNRPQFFDHPGPDVIRRKKVRRFMLVTDFVGSGDQTTLYLDAAWRVASTKSWWSGGLFRFEVVCFSATPTAIAKLKRHPCRPIITQCRACPTIASFEPYEGTRFRSLCLRYGPKNSETQIPRLGYGDIGALIAFAHGMPNNGPRFFYKKGRNWSPLFPARVTAGVTRIDHGDRRAELARKLKILRERQIAKLALSSGLDPATDFSILVLAALKRRPRTVEAVSSRTGLGIAETAELMQRALAAGWIDQNYRLTQQAYIELKFLQRDKGSKVTRFTPSDASYFPDSLRAPEERFS